MRNLWSTFIAAAILAASGNAAAPFDYGRFSEGSEVSKLPKTSDEYISGDSAIDDFVLSPSGALGKTRPAHQLNMIDSTPIINVGQQGSLVKTGAAGESASGLNTSYSSTSLKPAIQCTLSPLNASQIETVVARTAEFYGVDPSLAKAVAWAESRFDQNRVSDRGARGAMQLMPRTAVGLGVRDICDAVSNIDGGVRHLKLMLDEFRNPILAAAAYNAGAQAVYDNGGVPPFPETIRYVAAVLNHQMGLQMPRGRQAHAVQSSSESASSTESTSEVVGARGGRFIKGVMQF